MISGMNRNETNLLDDAFVADGLSSISQSLPPKLSLQKHSALDKLSA